MRKIIILFFIFSLFVNISLYSQTDLKMLEEAYKHSSKKKLKNFFDAWSREITPITDAELSTYNDTIQQAYKAFVAFYKPHRLDSICGIDNIMYKKRFFFFYTRYELDSIEAIQWTNRLYKDVDFLIVQNNFKIYFTDKIYPEFERNFYFWYDENENSKQVDSVVNFRPQINCNDKIPVYLTPKYDTLLNTFLGSEHLEFGTGGIMNVAQAKGKSKRKKSFLENYIKILHGHWGGYWHLCSFPEAYSITFDKDMEYALIYFRLHYGGGEAILKREGETWTLISSKLRWIE